MTSRNRSRIRGSVSGGYYAIYNKTTNALVGGRVDGGSGTSWYQTCADSTQPRPYVNDQPLTIIDYKAEPIRFNGNIPHGTFPTWEYRYFDYNPVNRSLYQYAPAGTAINWPYWVTKALSNMNPSRPLVDLPLFLFELKDFPHMLRQLGDVYAKGLRGLRVRDLPEWHLAYSFGWKPLVSDLYALIKLSKSIEERKAYLRSLESGTRLRRTLFKGEIQRSITPNGYSLSGTVTADKQLTEFLKVWYTANAKLLTPLSDSRLVPEYGYAQALGLNISAETLWNAVPWSWLIDYFFNVGDFLEANRGYFPWKASRMCLMAMTEVKDQLVNVRPVAGLTATNGGLLRQISKQRAVYSNPAASLAWDPFLSGHQVAILGSLLTSRSLKGIR